MPIADRFAAADVAACAAVAAVAAAVVGVAVAAVVAAVVAASTTPFFAKKELGNVELSRLLMNLSPNVKLWSFGRKTCKCRNP